MKKVIKFILLSSVLLTSCDPPVYLDLNIKNNCEQPIIVNSEIGYFYETPQKFIDTVYSHSQKCIYKCEVILGCEKEDILIVFEDLKITQNGKETNYNPVDTTRWDFARVDKDSYEAVLTVNPEDFE